MLAEVLLIMAALMLATVGQWIFFDQGTPFFQTFDSHTKHEWVGRINGIACQLGIIAYTLLQGKTSHWGAALFLAYLLHDTGHMLVYERDITSYLHHIVSVTVFGLAKLVMTETQIDSAMHGMAVLESTNPVLNISWLLHKAGYANHPAFKYLAGAMITFFAIMRCGVFPWTMTKMDTGSRLIFAPLLALNIYWLWKLINIGKKVITKTEEPVSNTSQSPST